MVAVTGIAIASAVEHQGIQIEPCDLLAVADNLPRVDPRAPGDPTPSGLIAPVISRLITATLVAALSVLRNISAFFFAVSPLSDSGTIGHHEARRRNPTHNQRSSWHSTSAKLPVSSKESS